MQCFHQRYLKFQESRSDINIARDAVTVRPTGAAIPMYPGTAYDFAIGGHAGLDLSFDKTIWTWTHGFI